MNLTGKEEQLRADQEIIDRLEKNELYLLQQLNEQREQLRKLKTEYWLKERGLQIGDAIAYKTGKGVSERIWEGKLTHFEYQGTNPAHPMILLFNKDGQIGKTRKRIFHSEIQSIIKI